MNFYELQNPTEWAEPPSTWSSTSIDDVEVCPRRWQLLHSRWGEFDRFPVRPNPAAMEGQIVHHALDRLTRACGQRGNPVFGSAEFSAALADSDFYPGFTRALVEWQQRLNVHPRPGPAFRPRASAEALANCAVRMFREQYKPGRFTSQTAECAPATTADVKSRLQDKRALSEVKITHPGLPFLGILDRVQLASDGVEIIDFKTGRPSEKHRRQLLRYALLWWRTTGEAPVQIRAQYPDDVQSWPVTREALVAVEADLARRIPLLVDTLRMRPALAKASADCHACSVRVRCADGWALGEEAARADGRGDAELAVMAKSGGHGFLARSRSGAQVAVVYEAHVAGTLPECVAGRVFRGTCQRG